MKSGSWRGFRMDGFFEILLDCERVPRRSCLYLNRKFCDIFVPLVGFALQSSMKEMIIYVCLLCYYTL